MDKSESKFRESDEGGVGGVSRKRGLMNMMSKYRCVAKAEKAEAKAKKEIE